MISWCARRLLEEKEKKVDDPEGNGLTKFEIAAIANLHPNEEEEAKALIQSLDRANCPNHYGEDRVKDDEMKELLGQLAAQMSYN